MKLSQLALTLVLVAGGIFVYDALVVRDPEAPTPEAIRSEPPPPPVEAELSPFAVLEGRGDEIWRSDIERRLEELELVPDTVGQAQAETVSSAPRVPGMASGGEADDEEILDENGQVRPRRFTPKDVATFRAMLQTVERQRREEKARRQMHDGLKKIGVELNDVQANQVVDLTLKLYRGFQAKTRTLPKSEEARSQRLAVFNEMKEDYADELYGIVPVAEADRIMDAINRRTNQQPKDRR